MRSRLPAILMVVFSVFWSTLLWSEDAVKPIEEPVEMKVANRSVIVLRAALMGEALAARVERAKAVIGEAHDEAEDLNVSIDPIQDS